MTETCVLCNLKLESKAALQDHFRKHANKEIDCQGRPLRILPLEGKPKSVKLPSRDLDNLPEVKMYPSKHLFSDIKSSGTNRPCDGASESNSSVQVGMLTSATSNENISNQASLLTKRSKTKTLYPGNNKPSEETGPTTGSPAVLQRFICDVCGMPFVCAAKAITHKWRAHPNQPSKFCCSHCGKQFPLKTILDNHVAEHHSVIEPLKVVTCEDCGEEFFNESAKGYHAKVTHRRVESVLRPVATPPPSKKIRLNNAGEAESVYYCHLCGSEYVLKFNLRKHLELRHSKEDTAFGPGTEIIRCTICEAIFCNKKAYEVHNMYHQPNDMYVTSEEHRLKTVSRVDQDFDLRRVQIQIPKTVRALARQKAKIVWNNPFPSTNSNVVVASGETTKGGCKPHKSHPKDEANQKSY